MFTSIAKSNSNFDWSEENAVDLGIRAQVVLEAMDAYDGKLLPEGGPLRYS